MDSNEIEENDNMKTLKLFQEKNIIWQWETKPHLVKRPVQI